MLYEDGPQIPHVHPRVQVTYLEEQGANIALGTFSALGSIHVIYTFNSKSGNGQ